MHGEPSQRSDCGCNDRTNADDDAIMQWGVLAFVIEEHPDHMTTPELVRAICRRPEKFGERDGVERAVRELVGMGLLHDQGAFVLPTRAALSFDRISDRLSA